MMDLVPVYYNDGVREFFVTVDGEQLYLAPEEDEGEEES